MRKPIARNHGKTARLSTANSSRVRASRRRPRRSACCARIKPASRLALVNHALAHKTRQTAQRGATRPNIGHASKAVSRKEREGHPGRSDHILIQFARMQTGPTVASPGRPIRQSRVPSAGDPAQGVAKWRGSLRTVRHYRSDRTRDSCRRPER